MKIQSINLFNINSNTSKYKKSQTFQSGQTTPQINKLSNNCYMPFFAGNSKKTSDNVINEFLNDESFEEDKKEYLKFLATIDNFSDAISGLNKDNLNLLITLCLQFSPCSEDILMGKYVAVYGDVEKPLIDLKSIATHNKKHPETPITLIKELFDNPLVTRFLFDMKKANLKSLNGIAELEYEDGEQKFKTYIKYLDKKIDSITLKKLKNAPLNEDAMDLLKFKSFEPEYKQTLWELTEIPYFNAATKNLSLDDLKMLVEAATENKAFVTEVLKGNVLFYDKKDNEKLPLLNLKEFVLFNHFKAPANRLFLTDYLFDNVIFTSLSNEIMKAKYYEDKYPAFFYAEQIVNGNEFVPYFAKDKKEAERAYRQCSNKYSPINHFIIFNNDLNDIDPISERDEIEQNEGSLKEKMILEKRKKYPSPKVVHEYLKNPDIDIENKKIVFNFAEEIPYFNYLMHNANRETLENLVYLKKLNSNVFDMFINEKIKIVDISDKYRIIKRPVIDWEQVVLDKGELNSLISKNSFSYDVLECVGKTVSKYNQKINQITIRKENTDCKSFVNYMNAHQRDFISIIIED